MSGAKSVLVVHGHRDGNAVGDQPWISAECRARVRVAEAAANRYGISDVLFSGSGKSGYPSEARQMAEDWSCGIVRIALDEQSADSAENAAAAISWARAIGATELVVVSSWWHFRLSVYYWSLQLHAPQIHYARTRRLDRVTSHLLHELRYLPRAMGSMSWRLESAARTRR